MILNSLLNLARQFLAWSNARRVNKIKIQRRIKPHKVESKAIFINFPTNKKVEREDSRARTQTKQKSWIKCWTSSFWEDKIDFIIWNIFNSLGRILSKSDTSFRKNLKCQLKERLESKFTSSRLGREWASFVEMWLIFDWEDSVMETCRS